MGGSVVFVFCIGSEEISRYQCAIFTLIGQSEKVGALLLLGQLFIKDVRNNFLGEL